MTADAIMRDEVVVVIGAAPLDEAAVGDISPGATVIAADGGLDHALAAGLEPSLLVGDLDSVSATALAWAERHATIERHDTQKDQTDTELACRRAADLNPTRLVLISGGGDRLDHTLGAVTALGHRSLTSIPTIDGWWGAQRVHVLHGPGRTTLQPPVGSTVSLLALHGACTGVTAIGVQWPLDAADLAPGVGLGISNQTVAASMTVSVSTGVLTILLPDPSTVDSISSTGTEAP